MATVRDVKDQVEELKGALRRMVATRALRDPLHDSHPDLTPPQCHVLAALSVTEGHALSSSVLAQRIHASAPTLTGIIDRLEKQGLVARERDDDDRRLVKVKLTAAGGDAVRVLDDHVTERLTTVLALLDPEERETFVRLLSKIIASAPEAKPEAKT